ncbi:angiotensin-converting enzyme-like [Haematobia irritans]|uniref:angiotensin-converting enzyme-like n=1 Tax=Haematobia irritans TaxID=7368 RepID=UPI003F4FA7B3
MAILSLKALIVYLFLVVAVEGNLKSNCFSEKCAEELMEQINEVYWEKATAYRQFSDDVISPEILMRENLRPFYDTLEKFDWKNFQNPMLQRQFQVILRGAKYPPLNYEFKRATNTLKSMSKQKFVCNRQKAQRHASPRCSDMAFIHQIKSVIANSDDLDEIKWYWGEWRSRMPSQIKDALHYYIHYYQNMSSPEMPASAIWYDQYEDDNFLAELEELMEAIQPFYKEMHGHLKHALRVRYGDDVIPPSGLIPHHLMEQAMYQSWKKQSVLRNPFPQRKLPNVQHELDDLEWFPFDLVNISCSFFGSMGFDNLTEDFMRDNFVEMEPSEGGPDCKSRIFTYGEIELNYCPKVYYKKLLQTHGDITQIQYAILKNNLSVGLNQEASPGFANAMGEAVILSVSTPQHLQGKLGLLTDYDYDDILNLNRLYRMAVHTVLTIPSYFVHEKLWADMIDNRVSPENYNCHYWNLMAKYMGVGPTMETKNGSYDMPYKFYEGIVDQFRSTRKLFGEFLGYQIYRAVCLKIGEFQRGNAYKILHNCDFGSNKQAGKIFKDIMSAGSTKPWRKIIKPITIKNVEKLTATAFLEYYEPLHTWIAEDNVEKNLPVGWKTNDDKCNPSTAALNGDTEVY